MQQTAKEHSFIFVSLFGVFKIAGEPVSIIAESREACTPALLFLIGLQYAPWRGLQIVLSVINVLQTIFCLCGHLQVNFIFSSARNED